MQKLFVILLVISLFGCKTNENRTSSNDVKYIKDIFGVDANKSTPRGIAYNVITSKNGRKPVIGDYGKFNFSQFKRDSFVGSSANMGRPMFFQFPEVTKDTMLNIVVEALKVMTEGDSISLFFPVDSLGPRVPPYYIGEKYMRIDFGLEKVLSKDEYIQMQQVEKQKQLAQIEAGKALEAEKKAFVEKIAADYAAGKLNGQITTTPSGLKYIIHEKGSGSNAPAGKKVSVNYYGALTSGKEFDNSYKRGTPFEFSLGQGRVIRGWDEGIALLNKGAKATFFIPSELGYGKAGSPPAIPGDSELIFYVELLDYK